MSVTALPPVPHYNAAPPTKADLDYADLATIDLSKMESAQGRAALASQVRDALLTHGFFYVVNHGYPQTQGNRMFDIADVPFSCVSDEEKRLYSDIDQEGTGWYQAYKLRQYWHIDAGVRDQLEYINIDRDVHKQGHPEALRPFLPEIEEFARFNHANVLFAVLRLIALSLELPEDALVKIHNCNGLGEAFVRFIKYYPRSAEDEEKTNNVWLKGHTDSGSITILWSQPVAALQILGKDGKWRWVKHVEDALVVNAGDAMDFLTGGYYKGTIHRVVQPPPDQQQYTRLGVFYFTMTDGDVKLVPLYESPVLKRVGINPRCEDSVAPTMLEWRRGRANGYGRTELRPSKEKGVEEEIINGLVIKHYN
ncbi:Clavaminate synthase-like protein [Pisolithus tinctorius]|nr:Clavaminate synthase-like protein [Pisolithus tinctorius]